MATIVPVIQTTFQLGNSPKNIQVADVTNYASEPSIDTNSELGILKITGPSGIVYQNSGFATNNFSSPDITFPGGINSNVANLPLDINGNVQTGTYIVEYKVQVLESGVPDLLDPISDTYSYTFVVPSVVIGQTIDCICSELTSTDATNYGTGIQSLIRTHTVTPPTGSGLSPTVSSNAVIEVSPISTNTWTTTISTDVEYLINNLYITATITGSKEIKVECASTLCDIYCCINTLYNRYVALRCTDPTRAKEVLVTQLDPVVTLGFLHGEAIKCGRNEDAAGFYSEILKLSECSKGCGCEGTEPKLITPLCTGGGTGTTSVVAVCGNGALSVSANTVGDTTTYTVCFDDDLLDKLNALKQVDVVGGTDISVDTVDSGDYNRTFTINFTGSTGTINNILSFIIDVDYSLSGSIATLNISDLTATGIFTTADINWEDESSTSAWNNSLANIVVSNFGSSTNYKPIAQIVEFGPLKASGVAMWGVFPDLAGFRATINNINSDDFSILIDNIYGWFGSVPQYNYNYTYKFNTLKIQVTLIA